MMRTPAPVERPVALTIAGSDSGGGAGIQADLKTMEAEGVFGTSVVTAVTAQNTDGVSGSHRLPIDRIEAQLDAVLDDFAVRAVKTGMLAATPVVELVAEYAAELDVPLIVDPVMVAESGDRLLEPAAESAYESLLAEATLTTPNAAEAEVLTGIEVTDEERALDAAEQLRELSVDAALVTGGHFGDEQVRDVLVTENDRATFEHPRVDTSATHGSGCTLSASIAARLARDEPLMAAVEGSTGMLERAIRYHHDVGHGPGAVHHLAALRERADRQPTMEAVHGVIGDLIDANVRGLVPEVGMNVVGATPYAEAVAETAAVEGRITRTLDGIAPNRGVRPGASSHVARFLLTAREFDPSLRFAANCRFDDAVERALDTVDGEVVEFDRGAEPDDDRTMNWGARRAFELADGTPIAVVDRGDVGKEPMARLLARNGDELADRMLAIDDAIGR